MGTITSYSFISILFLPFTIQLSFLLDSRKDESPAFYTDTENQTVFESEPAIFICSSTISPIDHLNTLEWYLNGTFLNNKQRNNLEIIVGPNVSVLRFKSVRKKDQGIVRCQIRRRRKVSSSGSANVADDVFVSESAYLNVLPKNTVIPGFPSSVGINKPINTFESGRPFAIECPLKGQPNPSVHWLKNGLPVDYSDSRIRSYQTLTSSSLKILSAIESDSGKYECFATNLHGTAFSSVFTIYIKERQTPPYFSFLSKNESVTEGSDLNLTCIVMGAPVPTVEWLDGEEQMQPERTNYGRAVLNLKDIRRSLDLTCRGQSKLGQVTSNVRVTVEPPFKMPNSFEASNVTSKSARLVWSFENDATENIKSGDDVMKFVVTLESHNAELKTAELESNAREATFTDLKPHSAYNATFRMKMKNFVSQNLMAAFRTEASAPSSAPRHIKVLSIPGEVVVKWDRPLQPDGPVQGYKVFISTNEDAPLQTWKVRTSAGSPITIKELKVGVKYFFCVSAYNEHGDGPCSDATFKFLDETDVLPPENFKVFARRVTSLTFSWSVSNDSNVIGYVMNYVNIPTAGGNKAENSKVINANITVAKLNDAVSEMNTTIFDLQPNTEYSFKLASHTKNGLSDFTDPVLVKTLQSVPSSAPVNIKYTPIDQTSIKITWSPLPPSLQNGQILGYHLHDTPISTKTGKPELGKRITLSPTETSYTLMNLVEWSKHQLKMNAFTIQGEGPWSDVVEIQTLEGIPGEPRKMKLSSSTSTSIRVNWKTPLEKNCILRGYYIYYTEVDDNNDQYVGSHTVHKITNASSREFTVEDLKPATTYDFQISAFSETANGTKTKPKRSRTLNVVISEPRDFQLNMHRHDPPVVRATWSPPHRTNQLKHVQAYELVVQRKYFYIDDDDDDDGDDDHEDDVDDKGRKGNEDGNEIDDDKEQVIIVSGDVHETLVENLEPGKEYEFKLSAKYMDEFGSASVLHYVVPRSSPTTSLQANLDSLGTSTMTSSKKVLLPPEVIQWKLNSSTASHQVVVKLEGKDETEMEGTYYLVVVQETLATRRKPSSFKLSELVSKDSNPEAWMCGQFDQSHFPIEFVVGDGLKDQVTNNRKLDLVNNAYCFFIRLVLNTGEELSSEYSSLVGTPVTSHLSGEPKVGGISSDKKLHFLFIVVPLCAVFIMVLVTILIVVSIRRRPRKMVPIPAISSINTTSSSLSGKKKWKQNKKNKEYLIHLNRGVGASDPVDALLNGSSDEYDNKFNQNALNSFTGGEGGLRGSSSLPTSVPLSHLLDRVQLLKLKDREMLRKEYESIDSGKQFTWSASNEEVNRCKNRYANVVAYDHSRVILPATSVPGSDYINANFIDCRSNNGGSLYIATQGPLLDTIGDFWRMIWEERVSTVAMVTKLEERSRVKCDQYWPDIGSQLYGVMQVTLKDVLELSSYTIRTFTLSKMNCSESREVFQLQFTSWPDYGVPSHPTLLLQYIRRVKSANELSPGPIVVHCSAGVGRTGVLIAIDTCMDRIMRGSETVDIFNVVTSLRSQRNYMVQSDDQYQFIYEAILEGVTSPANTEVTADNLNQYVRDLLAAGGAGAQRLRDEFQRLSMVRYEAQQFQYANMPFNKMKNRSSAILPLDSTRVNIQPIRGVEGSDYINANYIDGYRHKRCYIATQSPLATTVDDFWRMVWDADCSIIVMVTNLVEAGRERCVQYWPVERSMRYQYFVLDPSSIMNFGHYIVREFRMTDARDGQSRIIYQFQFLNWPQDDCHLSKYISSTSLTSSLTHLTNATLGQQFINFIGQVETTRSKLVDPTRPMVIHCELGSARTGAFISLSYILERMRTEGVVDVFETVKILRTQRMNMVTTEDIYSFCYRSSAQFLGSFDHYVK